MLQHVNFRLLPLNQIARFCIVSLILFSLLAFPPARVARASTWTVCPSGCDYTTIAAAVGSSMSGDTILLNVAGVHTEPAYVYIDRGVTIEGLGMYTTTWQAADTPGFSNHRLLETSFDDIPLTTIRNMTLRNGGSGSTGGYGPIVLNSPASLENLYIHHNYAEKIGQSANGGAVNVNDNVTISNCLITDNIVQSDVGARGGAIYASMSAILVVSNSTIANNQAIGLPATGGAGFPYDGSGGGIYVISSLTLSNSTVSGNIVEGCDVTTGTAGPGRGGGIAVATGWSTTVNISNSTISGNEAFGGNGPTKGTAEGGGIFHNSGTLTFTTVFMNEVSGLNAKGGGLYRYSTGTMNLQNSIIANNQGAKEADGPDLYGTYTSQDYNLIYKTSGSTLNGTTTHNITDEPPDLRPLADYGGDTQTHAPRLTSPVVNAIPSGANDCTPGNTFDQVGTSRPVHSGCEMGAYELPWVLYLPVVLR